ncbi:DUF2264 domain-containing protein [Jiangella alkaliphila]|uniref:DUF2264 domain-containing protein n=1 Tax=Jiangella alkaliphila TaxID=419479 RepID=A0A1H2L7U0_9ACTN|nr:DUF2264 domain-containing protein [Jiangella alkaliphila]SDU76872.1 hypothetical protein SAMN04488563_5344 [Jiangella alkaliphila]
MWPDRGPARAGGTPREGWLAAADRLLAAPRRHATPHHALIHLPGPASVSGHWSDGLEGFARTFLLAAFRLAGSQGADPDCLAGWYARGITAGVDPASPERWPRLSERRQARVEAASVAIGLHETREWIWDRLTDRTREQVVTWLAEIVGTSDYANNWIWFQNVVEAFLRSVGGPWEPADLERNLAAHDGWYAGDGWFTDGGTRNFDYYGGWAMHFYPVWYARICGDHADPDFVATTRDRLERYLLDAQYLVAADGAPVFQGRSLTYRFAVLAPFWAAAAAGAAEPEPGLTRRVADRVLAYFSGHGAPDERGLLPVGWHGAFARVRQNYSGAGSPYWASKGFAGLVLPPDHPAWTGPDGALPVERADVERVVGPPGWVVSATRADGIVRVLNHGTDHAAGASGVVDSPFYARHGYSSHAAPDLSQGRLQRPLDSHVALLDAAGNPSHRTPLRRVALDVDGLGLASCSRAHWLDLSGDGGAAGEAQSVRVGPWLTTASLVRGGVEVRLARVDPVPDGFGRPGTAASDDPDGHRPIDRGPWRLHVGGWTIASDAASPASAVDGSRAQVRTADDLTSVVIGVAALDEAGSDESDGANPMGRWSAVPWARTSASVEPAVVHAAVVVLSGAYAGDAARTSVTISGEQAVVTWADGATTTAHLRAPEDRG